MSTQDIEQRRAAVLLHDNDTLASACTTGVLLITMNSSSPVALPRAAQISPSSFVFPLRLTCLRPSRSTASASSSLPLSLFCERSSLCAQDTKVRRHEHNARRKQDHVLAGVAHDAETNRRIQLATQPLSLSTCLTWRCWVKRGFSFLPSRAMPQLGRSRLLM